MAETFLTVVHIIVALFMILVVLIQGGNQGGMGAAFGGGSSSNSMFGATGATSILGKFTYGAAVVFMLTSLTLSIIQGKSGSTGLKEKLKAQTQTESVDKAPEKTESKDD
jgi:preprotein translocase subunit SecG